MRAYGSRLGLRSRRSSFVKASRRRLTSLAPMNSSLSSLPALRKKTQYTKFNSWLVSVKLILIPVYKVDIFTRKINAVSHQARNVAVPSPVVGGLVRGSDCLKVGRTTDKTAAQVSAG